MEPSAHWYGHVCSLQTVISSAKGLALSKAINIIENGLKVGLDEESKDELTQNLIALYAYMVRRLLQANLRNDASAIEEVENLLRNIADGWKEAAGIPTLVRGRRLMSNAPQLYALYQQLLEQSQLMLRLARQGLWDDLIICETDYVNAVHSLARLTQESEPSTQIQEQLRPTLRVIPGQRRPR